MNQSFEDKINTDIRLMKKELVEIKELVKEIHNDVAKLTGQNKLTRSNSFAKFNTYKNEKHIELIHIDTDTATPNTTHFKRRATDSNIIYTDHLSKNYFITL